MANGKWETQHKSTEKGSDDWQTPESFFAPLHAEFNFEIDAAASPRNALLPKFWTAGDDALSQDWSAYKTVWCNPPYGRDIGSWLKKGWEASQKGTTVVFLIFARPDTQWWADYAWRASEWRFVQGRLSFTPADGGKAWASPAPSVVVIYRKPSWFQTKLKVIGIDRKGCQVNG